ncbi:cation:proton antiporter [Vulcanococcus sp. Clear-D1]|uniref:cation:proton antiporter domain-containing protein n=1 Tax=Vulcanococcus sp. Clear-D1 TaxID=2766970 RepID=UPI0019915C1A|nr:cation:proton antiporter [Vulcanococcus sp. Clear-D1]MBD1192865.1 cation:proton antiporter [Vulcanococcus sp. Clear-D1]
MHLPVGLLLGSTTGATDASLSAVPLEAQALFIGVVFLGTLIVSRFSIRIGIPAILGVLVLGLMINIRVLDVSHREVADLYTFALALLLFYAGLKTNLQSIRGFLEYGLLLAVGGVAISTVILGGAIYWLSSASGTSLAPGMADAMPLGAAFLIAACLGSTDAGATLSVLRQVQRLVPERVRHLLEFESSVNDPSALILYSICLGIFTVTSGSGDSMASMALQASSSLLQQLGSGLLVGIGFGYVAKLVINRFVMEKEQLLIVAMSIAFVDYGLSYFLGGSGYVAVYVTGVFMTNLRYKNKQINHESIQEVLLPFNTMTEISIFLLFGLLVNPADLLPCLPAGVAAAAALMLVARPVSVFCFQRFSPFNLRDSTLIAWCGLRGAVPLALSFNVASAIPNLRGLDPALATQLASNSQSIVFVAVILNLLVQGLSLPPVCRRLSGPPEPGLSS